MTGALLGGGLATARTYRPGRRVLALVRARDGRCRFPGCSVAARFCDVDHVRAWPAGPTSPANLMCLCRRHHRIKQRPGWSVRLHPDGRAVWTDPTARVRTTWPRDLLDTVVLPAPRPSSPSAAAPGASSVREAPTVGPPTAAGPRRSDLEVYLGVLSDHVPGPIVRARSPGTVPGPWGARVRLVEPEPRGRLHYAEGPRGHASGAHAPSRLRRRRDASGTGPPPF